MSERFLVSLTPSEGKKLIAMGIRRMEEVRHALKSGIVVISQGTTNAFVAEELLEELRDESAVVMRDRFAAGVVTAKALCSVPKEERQREIVIREGKVTEECLEDVIDDMTASDVFLKGANALDASGEVAGIFLGHPFGGTIGTAIGVIMARGVNFIIPVGLEKTIPFSINEASRRLGGGRVRRATGMPVGLMPVCGKIVTEVTALKILGADDAFPIGAGGVNYGEGSVVICVECSAERLDALMDLIVKIKKSAVRVHVLEESCEKCRRDKCVFISD
ncbi:MAG: hypothetical protein N2V77_07355 [Canidatus Methanoxibalbensis ujae]|nr:hypothetical protein [Candidatus Methanoxibalbensis ujae]MCW7077881.1 hypothetical protein [Candidatus Methanoxibalbensis ujae]